MAAAITENLTEYGKGLFWPPEPGFPIEPNGCRFLEVWLDAVKLYVLLDTVVLLVAVFMMPFELDAAAATIFSTLMFSLASLLVVSAGILGIYMRYRIPYQLEFARSRAERALESPSYPDEYSESGIRCY